MLFPEELHISRSLAKLLRQQRYRVTFDQDFAAVIAACAAPRSYADGTWITRGMQEAYLQSVSYTHLDVYKRQVACGQVWNRACSGLKTTAKW